MRFAAVIGMIGTAIALPAGPAAAEVPAPVFTKAFSPDTIGPGSTSVLTFTIDNSVSTVPTENLAFSDTMPAGVSLASPAFVANSCSGTVSAPNGGTTVELAGGQVGALETCTISVNVTAGAVDNSDTAYNNVSGDLTSSAGSSGVATADLVVDVDLPGFSKHFDPSSITIGGRSTLTFSIDNTLNSAPVDGSLSFVDILPTGMVVASPANLVNDCGNPELPPAANAVPGSNTVSLTALGIPLLPVLAAAASCTLSVDVIANAAGRLGNVSGQLSLDTLTIGKASAVLDVVPLQGVVQLAKVFLDDPTAPGDTTTLQFTVTNTGRDDQATAIAFADDLDATVAGLAPAGDLPTDPCGAGSLLTFADGVLTMSGGSLAPGDSCTIDVVLTVPAATAPAAYPNVAGPVTADVGGEPTTGNTAGDTLYVVGYPILTKTFTDDPVGAGGSATLEFTIANSHPTSTMGNIAFVDELTDNSGQAILTSVGSGFLPFPVSVGALPTDPCGVGSSLALVGLGTDRQGLELAGGSLGVGESCTFSVTIDIPTGFPAGTYTNTTEPITGEIDACGEGCIEQVEGPPASDDIEIVTAPQLTKEFVDDPAVPGGTTTLEFTLSYDAQAQADATAVAFTDDLSEVLTGLEASSVDSNTCTDATIDITDPTLISFSGGAIVPGATCTVMVTLDVPLGVSGLFGNTTSPVTAVVSEVPVIGAAASDDLLVTWLLFTKAFSPDTVIAGGTTTLTFTVTNTGGDDLTDLFLYDNLGSGLDGLTATAATTDTCGGTLPGFPVTVFWYAGLDVAAGSDCTIVLQLDVPGPDGSHLNQAELFIGQYTLVATDPLTVDSHLLQLTKEFVDDPIAPGGTVTLQFTLTNLSDIEAINGVQFSDDLVAALAGLEVTALDGNTCQGTTSDLPTGLFELFGGFLPPGGSCTITIDVLVPEDATVGVYANTTSRVLGYTNGELKVFGDPASDDLVVRNVEFTKSFDGPTTATGTAMLTFTITNLDAKSAIAGMGFTDDLDAALSGLVAVGPLPSSPCGSGSALSGTSMLSLTGGNLPAGGSCSFDVTVAAAADVAAGTYLNTTSTLYAYGLPIADPATAELTVEPPPTFAKSFSPDTILAGEVSTLTFTIDNSASALAAGSLGFVDDFPAGVVIADPANASTTCTGGALGGTPGTASFSYAGGAVGAGAWCVVVVDVTSAVAATHVNTTGALMSTSGNSGTATDTLTVTPVADVSVTKTDGRTTAVPGETTTYTIVVANAGPSDSPAVALVDSFPAALDCTWSSVAAGGATGNTDGSGDLAETLFLPAGSSVTYTAPCAIDPGASGVLGNTATASIVVLDNGQKRLVQFVEWVTVDPDETNNSATDVTTLTPVADVSVTKTADRTTAVPGKDTIVYTIVVASIGPSTAAAVEVTDVLPSALTCSWTTVATGGATGNTASGSGDIADTLTMPAGSTVTYTTSCSIDPAATGVLSNTVTVASATSSLPTKLTEGLASAFTDPVTANNSATEAIQLSAEVDVVVTKDDGVTTADSGVDTLRYVIVVLNDGPSVDPLVTVSDDFPAVLTCTWTSTAAGGATGNSPTGSGNIAQTLSMPPNSSVTFTASCAITPTASGTITNTVSATTSVTDTDTTNNTASDSNTTLRAQAPTPTTPKTGSDPSGLVRIALLLAVAGCVLVLISQAGRRRPRVR